MKDLQNRVKFLIAVLTILVITSKPAFAQETLQSQYNKLMEYSTYEKYKVIPITDINAFWANVDDSLRVKANRISQLEKKITELEVEMDTLNNKLSSVQNKLSNSRSVNDQIEFIGISFNKTAYHIMVWSIVIVLVVLAVIGYMMYMRSNMVTTRARKESESLRAALEDAKDKARETQVKLKRELQTAVNTIEEMRRGGARR